MNLKSFSPKISPWGFKVTFDIPFDLGYQQLKLLLGPQKNDKGEWMWYLLQDMGPNWRGANQHAQMEGRGYRLGWKKGRVYLFNEDLAVYLKLIAE